MSTPKVRIEDLCDGFAIIVQDGGTIKRFSFDQEDTLERLVDVFAALGLEATYEEVY